jgi:MATE family multidrug resistance protein
LFSTSSKSEITVLDISNVNYDFICNSTIPLSIESLLVDGGFSNTTKITEVSKPSFDKKVIIKEMLAVGVPSIAACIVEPLLTVIDSIFVARFSITSTKSITDLAAMSINGAIFNILAAATAPLCTGTTALVSISQGKDQIKNDQNKTNSSNQVNPITYKIFDNGLILSLSLGILLNILSSFCGKNIVSALSVNPQIEMQKSASQYFKIRMLSFPFTLSNYVIIGFSLGTQNVIAPMVSILTSFFANVIGDYIFIKIMKLGLTGAAIATSLSTVFASSLAILLIYKDRFTNASNSIVKMNIVPAQSPLKKTLRFIQHYFDINIMKNLFSTSSLLLVGSLLNTLTYSSGASISSFVNQVVNSRVSITGSDLKTMHAAAHQVTMQLWWFLSFFSTPLSLIAQALLPRDIMSKNQQRIDTLVKTLLQSTLFIAVLMTSLIIVIPTILPSLFTNSMEIQSLVKSVMWQVAVSQFIICVTTALDGLFIGAKLLKNYVTASFLSTTCAWLYYAYSINHKIGLEGTWNGLLIFSVVRLAFYLTQWNNFIRKIRE